MLEAVAHPGGDASVHVRATSDGDRLPCGLAFARARFDTIAASLTAEEAIETVTCPGCRSALEALIERRIA